MLAPLRGGGDLPAEDELVEVEPPSMNKLVASQKSVDDQKGCEPTFAVAFVQHVRPVARPVVSGHLRASGTEFTLGGARRDMRKTKG